MVSRQEVPRPLLTPGEVMQLAPTDALILTGGAPPIRARKVRYFEEPVFKARLRPPAAFASPAGPGIATAWDGLAAPAAAQPARPLATPRSFAGRSPSRRSDPRQKAFDFSAKAQEPASQEPAQKARPEIHDVAAAPVQAPDPAQVQFGLNLGGRDDGLPE
jgi:type IV secretion system protein VirD4